MDRYDRYKDSGVEWIGEIPEYWKLARISYIYDSRNTKVSAADYPALSVTMQGIVPQLESAAKTQDIDNRKLVLKGDFVINSRSDRRGSCGISELDGSVTLISNVLAPKAGTKLNRSYFSYLFKSVGFADEFYKVGSGIVDDLWSTNWAKMKNIQICIPPFEDQIKIGHFLDRKTSEIDSLTQKTDKSIELLQEYRKSVISEAVTKGLDPNVPMKDSGVEWIGEIPEGWSISSLKYLASIKGGSTPSKSNPAFWGGEIPWVSSQEVKLSRLTDTSQHITQEALDYCSNVVFPAETVVMVVRSGILKHTLPVSILDKPMTINQDIKAVQFFRDSQSAFFYYFVKGLNNALLHELCKDGSTVDNLDIDLLSRCPIIQPPIDEQTAIVNYLDQKTSEIDSLIEKKKQLVEKLQEYRKSLISECVTGKVKVPGVE